MAKHNQTGEWGEVVARKLLRDTGYDIVAVNWTCGKLEVDIIAQKDNIVSLVEVKTRKGSGFGQPEDFVKKDKRGNLKKAANAYLELSGHTGEINFDIIAIDYSTEDDYKITHIKDAFWFYK